MSRPAWAGSLALWVSVAAASDDVATLTVNVVGGRPAGGQVVVSLFDSEKSYMKAPVAEDRQPLGADGRATVTFGGLQPGDYAVSIFHDEDSDGELDTNFLGIPTEKVGFSNDAKPRMGPAPYEKARLDLAPGATEIIIHLGRARMQR